MKNLIPLLKFAAIAGNILFALWMTFNALKEHFSGTLPEKVSYVGLLCLFALNSWLILSAKQKQLDFF